MPTCETGLLASNDKTKNQSSPSLNPDKVAAFSLGFKGAGGGGLNPDEKTQLEALKRRNKPHEDI